MYLRPIALLFIFAALPGCRSTIQEVVTAADDASHFPLKTTLGIAGLGAAAYFIIDPLAPNWEVSETQLSDTRYRIDLRMKRFHLGGDGEAEPLFKRHAQDLAEQLASGEYRLISYSEGIDSNVTVPRRWSRGIVELSVKHAADDR